ncbi:MAG TPA: aminomethyl-transferring glycine dehydrogenase [Acidimicrobiales bacterium]
MPAPRPRLADLESADPFAARHIGPDDSDRAEMLAVVGAQDLHSLVERAVPTEIKTTGGLDLPRAHSEREVLNRLRTMVDQNDVLTSLIGLGYYGTITPPVIQRNVLENPAWYTAYTPYQPEISQGRLEALLNFQTMVADLTGMDIANASLLDEATAAAEAMTMARRITRHPGSTLFVDEDIHPQTLAVLETRASALGIPLLVGDAQQDAALDLEQCYGVLVQTPASSGRLVDWSGLAERVHAAGGVVIAATDLLACVLVQAPGQWGADLVVGSAQRFGVPMGFGGPHAAFIACREADVRSLPGRLVGVSTDGHGRPALRLTLQTREQHIRREKATSNICTAQVLLANMAGLYACWHGAEGLRAIAGRTHRLTSVLGEGLRAAGLEVVHDTWFDTIAVRVPGRAAEVAAAARDRRINVRVVDADTIGLSLDETTTREVVWLVWEAFGVTGDIDALDATAADGIPPALRRRGEILVHPVFSRYRSEHEMLRYLRRLADRDLALDRTMIPLGSCTMKLNATAEMIPVTWPGLAHVHPFAPADQVQGYLELIAELTDLLVEITGYDAVSLQPNAGSQGEYAGLLAIRAYHRSRGDEQRNICLIPSSAHGTNAASAVMAGMQVQVVACDDRGNVDLADLQAKVDGAGERLAAAMVTYPSTHGVFERGITDLCRIVHDGGGQVYVDGANLNALVGVAQPGRFGADVSHLNLHKTFCIPHGGGGPGVGPIGVRAHLAAFLPNHPLAPEAGPDSGIGPVAAAPYGSAGILAISWVYIHLMGAEGLTAATANAILNANYVARRLQDSFPVLYTGEHGDVAHECILDLRELTKETGVTAEDVAKRLMDYGFHAPTLSFPVPGTLMVEPTESESKHELDRFVAAMVAIRGEIERVRSGEWLVEDSPLRHAPHTAADVAGDAWDRPYSRALAAFPVASLRTDKYFTPVGRIDQAYGDRNIMCSCPPVETYAEP